MKIRRILFWLTVGLSILCGALLCIYAGHFNGLFDFLYLFLLGCIPVWVIYLIGKFIESTVIVIMIMAKGKKLLVEKKKSKSTKLHKTACILLAIFIPAVLFIFMGILPTFKTVFESFGKALPTPTMILLNISDFFVNYFYISIPIIIVLYILAVIFMKRLIPELQKFLIFLMIICAIFVLFLIVAAMFMPMFEIGILND